MNQNIFKSKLSNLIGTSSGKKAFLISCLAGWSTIFLSSTYFIDEYTRTQVSIQFERLQERNFSSQDKVINLGKIFAASLSTISANSISGIAMGSVLKNDHSSFIILLDSTGALIAGSSQLVQVDNQREVVPPLLARLQRTSVLSGTHESDKELEGEEHYSETPYILKRLKFSKQARLSSCYLSQLPILSLPGNKRIGFERLSLKDISCLGLNGQINQHDLVNPGYQGLALLSVLHLSNNQILIEGLLLDNLDDIPNYLLEEHFARATTIADQNHVYVTNFLDSRRERLYKRNFSSTVLRELLVKGNYYKQSFLINNRNILAAYTPLFRDYPEVSEPLAFLETSDDGRFSEELSHIRIVFYLLALSLGAGITCVIWLFNKKIYGYEDQIEYANSLRDRIIESIHAGVIGIDKDGLIQFTNKYARQLLCEELLGKHYGRFVDSSIIENVATLMASLDSLSVETSSSIVKLYRGDFFLKDQTRIFCEFALSPLKSNDILCLIIFRDIREVLSLEEAKENAAALAERRRIIRELRDGLANKLAVLSIQIQSAIKESDNGQLLERLQKANELALDCMVVSDIHSQPYEISELPYFDLVSHLQKTLNEVSYSGLKTSLLVEGEVKSNFSSTWALPVIKVVEMVIYESVRRPDASQLQIRLTQQRDCYSISISDNSYQFNQNADQSNLDAISSIRDAASSLGADLMFSYNDEGTYIKLTFHLS